MCYRLTKIACETYFRLFRRYLNGSCLEAWRVVSGQRIQPLVWKQSVGSNTSFGVPYCVVVRVARGGYLFRPLVCTDIDSAHSRCDYRRDIAVHFARPDTPCVRHAAILFDCPATRLFDQSASWQAPARNGRGSFQRSRCCPGAALHRRISALSSGRLRTSRTSAQIPTPQRSRPARRKQARCHRQVNRD